MPKALEEKLHREAEKQHMTGKRKAAYMYGTMAKLKKKK
jgi:hypothetical protein